MRFKQKILWARSEEWTKNGLKLDNHSHVSYSSDKFFLFSIVWRTKELMHARKTLVKKEPTSSFCLCKEKLELPSDKAAFSKATQRDRRRPCPIAHKGVRWELPSLWGCHGPHGLHWCWSMVTSSWPSREKEYLES